MKYHFNKNFWRDGFFFAYLLLTFLWVVPLIDGLPLEETVLCIVMIIFLIGSILSMMFKKD